MQTDTSWRGAYARLAGQLIGANPLIGREEIAERLAVPVDDLDRILAHPMAPVLQRWAQRAAEPGTGMVWLERTNA